MKTINEIQQHIDLIAIECFNMYRIERDSKLYELAEIEIYLQDESQGINDIFRHQKDEHLNNGTEYIHYSGFDICHGNKEKNIYCGILVRGIMNDSDSIYGPRRVKYEGRKKVPRVIEINKVSNLNKLLKFYDGSNIINENMIFKLPRVNLSNTRSFKHLDNPIELSNYLNLKVRYLRIKNKKFFSSEGPAESREVFNAMINYKPN